MLLSSKISLLFTCLSRQSPDGELTVNRQLMLLSPKNHRSIYWAYTEYSLNCLKLMLCCITCSKSVRYENFRGGGKNSKMKDN